LCAIARRRAARQPKSQAGYCPPLRWSKIVSWVFMWYVDDPTTQLVIPPLGFGVLGDCASAGRERCCQWNTCILPRSRSQSTSVPPCTDLTIVTRYDSSAVEQCIDPINSTIMDRKQWVVVTGKARRNHGVGNRIFADRMSTTL
jgi:hypothetical protein